jgi:hypothetical protein
MRLQLRARTGAGCQDMNSAATSLAASDSSLQHACKRVIVHLVTSIVSHLSWSPLLQAQHQMDRSSRPRQRRSPCLLFPQPIPARSASLYLLLLCKLILLTRWEWPHTVYLAVHSVSHEAWRQRWSVFFLGVLLDGKIYQAPHRTSSVHIYLCDAHALLLRSACAS